MKPLSAEKKAQLKIELSKRPELVESFLRRSDDADNFTEIPWLEVATAVAVALTFLDQNLKTVASILEQFDKIKKWFDGKIDGKDLPLGERLIALSARSLNSPKGGCSVSEMLEKVGPDKDDVVVELKRLSDAGYVREEQGVWKFVAED